MLLPFRAPVSISGIFNKKLENKKKNGEEERPTSCSALQPIHFSQLNKSLQRQISLTRN
jgi:hypothetical protein